MTGAPFHVGERLTGRVFCWFSLRGYGFLDVAGHRDRLFCHAKALANGASYLTLGDPVEFTVARSQPDGRLYAKDCVPVPRDFPSPARSTTPEDHHA